MPDMRDTPEQRHRPEKRHGREKRDTQKVPEGQDGCMGGARGASSSARCAGAPQLGGRQLY
eukprot:370679-Pyramimonas_sp.AAC.1